MASEILRSATNKGYSVTGQVNLNWDQLSHLDLNLPTIDPPNTKYVAQII